MKTTGLTLFAVMGLLIVGSSVVTSTVFAGENQIDVAAVVEHAPDPDPDMVFGTSVLLRTDEGVAFTLDTTDLVLGNAYTLWMLIDESPATAPAGNEAFVPFEIRLRIDGEFAAPDGSAGFSGFLPAGDLPAANGLNVLANVDGSFDDPEDASILFLVRDHGQLIPGMGFEQTHYVGGCGTGGCTTVQEAFHMGAGATLSLDVCVDVADRIDVDPPVPPQLHPFHIAGVIFDRGGTTPIGTYRCWGWRNPGEVSVINQVYSIDGRGSIQTQGLESFAIGAPRPVVGGDGDFIGVRGVGIIGPSFVDGFKPAGCSDSATVIGFEIDFHLLGGLN